MPSLEQVLGPAGALVIALAVIGGLVRLMQLLWRDHIRADVDDRRQRDENFLLARDAVDALKRLAAAFEERNRRDAIHRARKTDP